MDEASSHFDINLETDINEDKGGRYAAICRLCWLPLT